MGFVGQEKRWQDRYIKMPAKIYHVKLTDEERLDLNGLVNKGKGVARRLTRSRILLLADENRDDGGWKDTDIAQALGVSQRTIIF